MKGVHFLLSLFILALATSFASASGPDPDPVQDFCVAVDDHTSALFVNGKFCKDPKHANADDFNPQNLW